MFRKLHIQMTAFSCAVTSAIVIFMTCVCLFIAESSLKDSSYDTFANNTQSVIFHMENSSLLSHQWLLQIQDAYKIRLEIRDNGRSLFFEKLNPSEELSDVYQEAAQISRDSHGIDILDPARSSLTSSAIFQMDDYYACTAVIPKENTMLSLCILYPLVSLNQQLIRQRLIFALAAAAAVIALAIFSWLFTRKMIQPLEESRRRQTEFIASASHELRSPLAVILSNTQALQKASPQDTDRFIRIIRLEGERMSWLIGDMLTIANADNHSWKMLFAPCELDTLLLDTYEKYEPLFQEKGLRLSVALPEDPLSPCTCDSSRISQVLGILLDNALSYVPACGGKVCLSLSCDSKYYYLAVADNGPGIPNAQKESVFTRFYRADSSRRDKSHFGLGLSIAREILKLHKGSIAVTDTPGGGSTFTLALPR